MLQEAFVILMAADAAYFFPLFIEKSSPIGRFAAAQQSCDDASGSSEADTETISQVIGLWERKIEAEERPWYWTD